MRVLITLPSLDPGFGGPTQKATQMARSIIKQGHTVNVIGCGRADGATGLRVLTRFHRTPVPAQVGPLLRAVGRADLVHVLGFRDPVGTIAAAAATTIHVPYVLEPTGMFRRRLRTFRLKAAFDVTIGRLVVRHAALIIATSRLEAAELVAGGVAQGRIAIRPNGVSISDDLRPTERGAYRSRMTIPLGVPLVVALGRISRKKGLDVLIRAIASLPSVWAVVVGPDDGDGTLRKLEDLRDRLQLGSRVIIDSRGVWGADKAEMLADADVLCQPSESENFGNAAAEAAAAGVPVVVSQECGVLEWLSSDSCLTVPYGDAEALALALESALCHPIVRTSAERDAPEVRARLSWSAVARQQIDLYRAVLAEHR